MHDCASILDSIARGFHDFISCVDLKALRLGARSSLVSESWSQDLPIEL